VAAVTAAASAPHALGREFDGGSDVAFHLMGTASMPPPTPDTILLLTAGLLLLAFARLVLLARRRRSRAGSPDTANSRPGFAAAPRASRRRISA